MPEFLKLLPPDQALDLLLRSLPDRLQATETIGTRAALGRVSSEDVLAPHSLPSFPRSTVDGYALHARESFGASESIPGYLTLVGEVPMGSVASFSVQPGQAALIHTGGMLPQGADAVIMLEQTQMLKSPGEDSKEIEILRAVAEGENILLVGEDVKEGEIVLPRGVRLYAAETGGAMSLGITNIRVAMKPKIGIISSGDEIVPPDQIPSPGQVRDVNSYSLAALVTEAGGEPVLFGIIADRLEDLEKAVKQALAECEGVVVTAGSSASARDMTAEVIASCGAPGVLVHGLNVRPGKPTILGVCDGKAVIGLPGNPVSALVIAGLFVVPVIEKYLGLKTRRPRPSVQALLMTNVPSQAGREDWVAVRLSQGENGWQAEPIFAKSNLIFSLVKADGLIRIHPDQTGLAAGEVVTVFLD
jgi:molybdopterin molybdotransferase